MNKKYQIIEEITNIRNSIINECQKEIYCEYRLNSLVYQKTLNACNLLFNNALRIKRKQTSLIKELDRDKNLCTTKNILQKIYTAILSFEMPPKKENMIIKILKEYNIDENKLLIPTPTYRNDYASSCLILEGLL